MFERIFFIGIVVAIIFSGWYVSLNSVAFGLGIAIVALFAVILWVLAKNSKIKSSELEDSKYDQDSGVSYLKALGVVLVSFFGGGFVHANLMMSGVPSFISLVTTWIGILMIIQSGGLLEKARGRKTKTEIGVMISIFGIYPTVFIVMFIPPMDGYNPTFGEWWEYIGIALLCLVYALILMSGFGGETPLLEKRKKFVIHEKFPSLKYSPMNIIFLISVLPGTIISLISAIIFGKSPMEMGVFGLVGVFVVICFFLLVDSANNKKINKPAVFSILGVALVPILFLVVFTKYADIREGHVLWKSHSAGVSVLEEARNIAVDVGEEVIKQGERAYKKAKGEIKDFSNVTPTISITEPGSSIKKAVPIKKYSVIELPNPLRRPYDFVILVDLPEGTTVVNCDSNTTKYLNGDFIYFKAGYKAVYVTNEFFPVTKNKKEERHLWKPKKSPWAWFFSEDEVHEVLLENSGAVAAGWIEEQ